MHQYTGTLAVERGNCLVSSAFESGSSLHPHERARHTLSGAQGRDHGNASTGGMQNAGSVCPAHAGEFARDLWYSYLSVGANLFLQRLVQPVGGRRSLSHAKQNT